MLPSKFKCVHEFEFLRWSWREIDGYHIFSVLHSRFSILLFYGLCVAHAGVSSYYFFPGLLYFADWFLSRRGAPTKTFLKLEKAEELAGQALRLTFRNNNSGKRFDFSVGQHVELVWRNERHPFAICSGPNEEVITLLVKAPDNYDWCSALRQRLIDLPLILEEDEEKVAGVLAPDHGPPSSRPHHGPPPRPRRHDRNMDHRTTPTPAGPDFVIHKQLVGVAVHDSTTHKDDSIHGRSRATIPRVDIVRGHIHHHSSHPPTAPHLRPDGKRPAVGGEVLEEGAGEKATKKYGPDRPRPDSADDRRVAVHSHSTHDSIHGPVGMIVRRNHSSTKVRWYRTVRTSNRGKMSVVPLHSQTREPLVGTPAPRGRALRSRPLIQKTSRWFLALKDEPSSEDSDLDAVGGGPETHSAADPPDGVSVVSPIGAAIMHRSRAAGVAETCGGGQQQSVPVPNKTGDGGGEKMSANSGTKSVGTSGELLDEHEEVVLYGRKIEPAESRSGTGILNPPTLLVDDAPVQAESLKLSDDHKTIPPTGASHQLCAAVSFLSPRRAPVLTRLRLAGPFGPPVRNFFAFQTAVLIATGIAVTPFAAILRHWAGAARNGGTMTPLAIHVFWTVRNNADVAWFWDILTDALTQRPQDLIVKICVKHDCSAGPVGSSYLNKTSAETGVLVTTRRPFVWVDELKEVAARRAAVNKNHSGRAADDFYSGIGVFHSGHAADEVRLACRRAGATRTTRPSEDCAEVVDNTFIFHGVGSY